MRLALEATHYWPFVQEVHNAFDGRVVVMISHNCLYAPGARTLLSTSFLRSVDPGGIFGDGHGGTVVWLSRGSDLQQLAATRPNGDLQIHILGTRGDDGLIVLKVDDLSASVRSKLRSTWAVPHRPYSA